VTALDAIGRARLARDRGYAARAVRLQEACTEMLAVHHVGLDVRGRWPMGPAVIVSNHVGYLETLAIAACIPCAPIAKAEVASWPIIGAAAARLGAMFVTRERAYSRVRVLRRALSVLQAGVPVLNFPEGTTSDGTRLGVFSRGIFGAAQLAGVPVIPVAVRCASELTWHGNAPFVPHYLRFARMPAPSLRLDVLERIDSSRFSCADELADFTYYRLARALDLVGPRVLKVAS
jgi:1-acyl-sn-glycerol-3-phosphate acyltransferase